MDEFTKDLARVALMGMGATAVMDAWLVVLRKAGVPTLDFALIGRWAGHLARGTWSHDSIARSGAIRGELALGWAVHYATGIAFALLLAAIRGFAWLRAPGLGDAVVIGLATVLAPWLVMQPAMGAGIAASHTPAPMKNRLRSLANHAVFGVGLYLSATTIQRITQ